MGTSLQASRQGRKHHQPQGPAKQAGKATAVERVVGVHAAQSSKMRVSSAGALIIGSWPVAISSTCASRAQAPPQKAGDKPRLSCQLYQRSADIFLGVPFNIASYALLTHMVAQQCDMDVGDFIWTGGDCHIYSNHHEQVELQLTRSPFPAPTLHIKRRPDSIFDYQFEDFEVRDYQCHPAIKAPVAV